MGGALVDWHFGCPIDDTQCRCRRNKLLSDTNNLLWLTKFKSAKKREDVVLPSRCECYLFVISPVGVMLGRVSGKSILDSRSMSLAAPCFGSRTGPLP